VRTQFLGLAKMWMTAAQQMDDGFATPLSLDNRKHANPSKN
jgi:hypothetical protein